MPDERSGACPRLLRVARPAPRKRVRHVLASDRRLTLDPLIALDAAIFLSAWALGGARAAWLLPVAFRAGLVLNALANEWGHIAVGLGLGAGRRAANVANWLGRRPLTVHLLALVPGTPDRRGDLTVRIRGLSLAEASLVRRGGFWLAAACSLLFVGVSCALVPAGSFLPFAYTFGTLIALLGAAVSDLSSASAYATSRELMACGNVTVMGRLLLGEKAALPPRGRDLLLRMLRVSQMRGAQSGGGAVQIRRGQEARHVIQKYVNPKRGDLGGRLTATLDKRARSHTAYGGVFLVQSHVRYATAGLTTLREAHPFRFIDVEQRGPKRVHQGFDGGQPASAELRIETALTHNGDMDGLRFRGRLIPYPDLGCFLERILGVQNRWTGDSPLLAAAIELYLTRGTWLESLRLAYHLTVAPVPPDFSVVSPELVGEPRQHALRALLASHPAPSWPELRRWESLAEAVFEEEAQSSASLLPGDIGAVRRKRERLAARLATCFENGTSPEIPRERAIAFARAAVNAFFDNDLYIALRKLEPALVGTFGCVVTSTLEPGCLVVLSRGQPLSLGFQRENGAVGVASERAALKVKDARGELAFDERIDLDLCRGEIARIVLEPEGPIAFTLYGIAEGREYHSEELVATGRLVPLRDNPYVSTLPVEARHRTEADIEAVPALLERVRADWRDERSHNRQAAHAFAEALLGRARPRLLVIGITNDLWLAEQFVKNLCTLFPELCAEARSSNQVLLEGAGRPLDPDTVVLAVSQSGQDFPTLGALVLLMQRHGEKHADRFFVLTGEVDSLMGQAVGQSYARGAAFSRRIFANASGFRPSEAAIATVNATQHTFVELTLLLAAHALDRRRFPTPPLGVELTQEELRALEMRRDFCVEKQAKGIMGAFADGKASEVSALLSRQSRRFTWHVLEGIVAFGVAVLVLELNIGARLGLTPSRLLGLLPEHPAAWLAHVTPVLHAVGRQLDVLFYAFLAPLAVWLLRAVQGRPLFHRQGVRELLIGDTRYVHQILWLLSRKLFSLSYGFASIKPYSADCQDELVMIHEPLRGTLALVGIPDSATTAQKPRGAAAMMAAKQFNNSRSLAGAGAEIVTISHAPRPPGSPFGTHVTLPRAGVASASGTAELLFEDMFDSWERLMTMQVFLDRVARGVAALAFFGYDRSRTKDQVFAPTTAAPVSAAEIYQLLARTAERYEPLPDASLPFAVVRSEWRGSAPPGQTTVWRIEPE